MEGKEDHSKRECWRVLEILVAVWCITFVVSTISFDTIVKNI